MAYDFNGTNQSMQTATVPVSAPPLTMACWFNSDSLTTSQTAILIRSATISGRPYMGLFVRGHVAGDPITAGISDGASFSGADSTASYSANTWHHGCAVFASTTSRTIYLDGGNSATNTDNRVATPQEIRIGVFVNFNDSQTAFMNGRLAEVGIWNAVLTAAEIASLAKGMTCDKVRPQNLVFYAPLVRDLIDQKGGLAITNNNGATVANHPRVYA